MGVSVKLELHGEGRGDNILRLIWVCLSVCFYMYTLLSPAKTKGKVEHSSNDLCKVVV